MVPHDHPPRHPKRAPLLHHIFGFYGLLLGGVIMKWTQRGFSIVLVEGDSRKLFVTYIRIYFLASVDQINRKPRLLCNLSEEPDDITPSVNT